MLYFHLIFVLESKCCFGWNVLYMSVGAVQNQCFLIYFACIIFFTLNIGKAATAICGSLSSHSDLLILLYITLSSNTGCKSTYCSNLWMD